ncbi:hypothetical protein ABTE18_21710, partial [Acinetobacter baumannii]
FDEHARLSAHRNGEADAGCARRVFNLSGLTGMDKAAYDAMAPIQWPVQRLSDGSISGTARVLEDHRFTHADGRARFVPTA